MEMKSARTATIALCLFFAAVSGQVIARVCHVDASAQGLDDGTSWTDAYTDLQ